MKLFFINLLLVLTKATWIVGPYSPCLYYCNATRRTIKLECDGICDTPAPILHESCSIEPRLYDFELGTNITKHQASVRSVFHPDMTGDAVDKYDENKDWIYR